MTDCGAGCYGPDRTDCLTLPWSRTGVGWRCTSSTAWTVAAATWRATQPAPKAPKSAGDGNGFDIHDEAALDAWMKKTLAEFERTRMTDEELDALLDEITADQ